MSVSILAIDDELDVADLFLQHFRREVRQGRYVLHFACSAAEALDKLARGIEPELIVMSPGRDFTSSPARTPLDHESSGGNGSATQRTSQKDPLV